VHVRVDQRTERPGAVQRQIQVEEQLIGQCAVGTLPRRDDDLVVEPDRLGAGD
jgi:hypothetical protein